METTEQRDKRRSNNLHSLSELESAGNRTLSINESKGSLIMRRGSTYTNYSLVEQNGINYWTPISAHTD